MSTTHPDMTTADHLAYYLGDGQGIDVDLPGPMVRRGRLGTWVPSVCPTTDAIIGGTFHPAPPTTQLVWGAITGLNNARRHLDHVASHDPDAEPF